MTDPTPDPTDPRLAAMSDSSAGEATMIVPVGFGSPVPPAPEPGAERTGGRVYGAGEVYGTPRQPGPTTPMVPEPAAAPVAEPAATPPEPAGPTGPLPGADRGSTSIDPVVVERVIEKIVNLTVADVEGVDGLCQPDPAGDGEGERPVQVILEEEDARIALAVRVRFGYPVHQLVEQVRSRVVTEAERLLGLSVAEVNVRVADVVFDSGE
ncbi:MAG TPA: Asp23/Gls24 family envelope stress response protein [Natronosporangium sp.]|nr:Asp23/Gls24 family envelope stress response protein [Natronosporangium sp.]